MVGATIMIAGASLSVLSLRLPVAASRATVSGGWAGRPGLGPETPTPAGGARGRSQDQPGPLPSGKRRGPATQAASEIRPVARSVRNSELQLQVHGLGASGCITLLPVVLADRLGRAGACAFGFYCTQSGGTFCGRYSES
jgi:hypothetical protein